jgi:Protein of unknown function (DUF2934)
MRFATSLCRGADRSRPRASTWMRHGVALRNSNRPASVFHFVVKQTGGRELVQDSSKGTTLSGWELVWRVGFPVNAGLGTVSPQTPKPPGRDRASYGGAYEQYPDEQIRNYAHQLWDKAGRPEGKADEFWRQAEIELDAESESVDPSDQPNASTIPG